MMFKELELGPRQRATVAAAITLVAVFMLLAVFTAGMWGMARFVGAFRNVLLPPVVAAILAMLLRPYYNWLVKSCRGSRSGALVLFFLFALVPLGVFIWFVGTFAVNQLLRLFEDLPSMLNAMLEGGRSLWTQVAALLKEYGLLSEFGTLLEDPSKMVSNVLRASWSRMSQPVAQMFQSAAGLFAWAVLPVYLAFFLMAKPFEPRQLGDFLPFLKKETREDVIYLLDQFISILLTFFRGQIIIALAQGVLLSIGFALIGFPYSIVTGMMLAIPLTAFAVVFWRLLKKKYMTEVV